jgi:hypothetical protein
MAILWSQHIQRMASQYATFAHRRVWAVGRMVLFQTFHCTTLCTMWLQKYFGGFPRWIQSWIPQKLCVWYRKFSYGIRHEPLDRDTWSCKAYIEESLCADTSVLKFKESYVAEGGIDEFAVFAMDPLMITKQSGGAYTVHRCEPMWGLAAKSVDVSVAGETSNVRFLCIQYSHPKMGDKRIELTIPREMMRVWNQLLSPTFVMRLLEYTLGPNLSETDRSGYYFDLDYTLSLMDSHIRMFDMHSNQFLRLDDEDTYVVDTIPVYSLEAYTSLSRRPASSPLGSPPDEETRSVVSDIDAVLVGNS